MSAHFVPAPTEIVTLPTYLLWNKAAEVFGPNSGLILYPFSRNSGYQISITIRGRKGRYSYWLNAKSGTIRYGGLKPGPLNGDLDFSTIEGWENAVLRSFCYWVVHELYNGNASTAAALAKGQPLVWEKLIDKIMKGFEEMLIKTVREGLKSGASNISILESIKGYLDLTNVICLLWQAVFESEPPRKIGKYYTLDSNATTNQSLYPFLAQIELGIHDAKGVMETF